MLPVWLVACGVCAVVAAVASPTLGNVLGFALGWGVFAVALWWTLATVRTYRAGEQAQSPKAILDARLANGEISIDEYHQLRDALTR